MDGVLKWEEKDSHVLSLIILFIGDSQIHHVSFSHTSKEAWDSLKAIFGQTNAATRLFLKKWFYQLEMEEGKSVVAYVSDIKEMRAQLASAGALVSKEEGMFVLLASLPRKFDSVVGWIAIQLNQTMESDTSLLIQEENRGNSSPSEGSSNDFA